MIGEPFYEEIQSYKKRFLPLLQAEQEEGEQVTHERLSTWSIDRLKAEGYCLTDLSAYWLDANHFGRPVASFMAGPGVVLPEHRFEPGTQIFLSHEDPLKEPSVTGSIVSSTGTHLRISFKETFELRDNRWRIDVGQTDITYRRMRDAITHLNNDPIVLASPEESVPDRQVILQGTHLRDVLLRSFAPAEEDKHAHEPLQDADDESYVAHETLDHASKLGGNALGVFSQDMRIHSWAVRHSVVPPIKMDGDPVLEGLNEIQVRAVALMIRERMSLVQGPPGTGKTRTIVETIKLLKSHFQVPHPLLVCTYTNVAVDTLVEGFSRAGLEPLRVGYTGKENDKLMIHTLQHKVSLHPLSRDVKELEKSEERLTRQLADLYTRIAQNRTKATTANMRARVERQIAMRVSMEQRLLSIQKRIYGLKQTILRNIVQAADVVCTTCIGSASAALNVMDFPVVFLDEASMSTEPASLIPLVKGSAHAALIGDHKQLPPVITSKQAQANGLGISLFERLTEEGVVPSIMLDIQYRMHPAISRFPSSEFYNFSLQDGSACATLLPPYSALLNELATEPLPAAAALDEDENLITARDAIALPSVRPCPSVVFLDHAGSESAKDRSRVNWNEAYIVCSVIEDLLLNNETMRGQDIGIIAPYVAQISLLTRLLNTDKRFKARFERVLGPTRARELAQIEVKTVDGFEGREKDVIIFSTVRNNPGGYIGFLADRRRLNVGLTRAKRSLVVVGSLKTLASSSPSSPLSVTATAGVAQQQAEQPLRYRTMVGHVTQQHRQFTTKKRRETSEATGTMHKEITTGRERQQQEAETALSSVVGHDATTTTAAAKNSPSESLLKPSPFSDLVVAGEEQAPQHVNQPPAPAIAATTSPVIAVEDGEKENTRALSQRKENSPTAASAAATTRMGVINSTGVAAAASTAPRTSTRTAAHRSRQQQQNKGDAWWRFAEFLHQERLVIELTGERLQRALYGQMSVSNKGSRGLGPGGVSASGRSRSGRVGVVVSLDADA